jgi:DNA-binding NtrC family response regulator
LSQSVKILRRSASPEHIGLQQGKLLQLHSLVRTRAAVLSHPRFGLLLGDSRAMKSLYETIERVASTTTTVLIVGESGTGKELVARTIHDKSARHDGPFLALNCGAIPADLVEAELFGHERGSFTGATRLHKGYFERANGGTLFLDEVTEMPIALQVRLLRVLETGKFFRVGGTGEVPTDARILAATNRDPRQAIADGRVREDLIYRLSCFPIRVPPLREREEDSVLLARVFVEEFNDACGADKVLSNAAEDSIRMAVWRGNVRELRNVVQRAFIMADDWIEIDDACGLPVVDARSADGRDDFDGTRITVGVGATLAEIERRAILATLRFCRDNKRETAETLGLSLKTLYTRLALYRGLKHSSGENC